jgi:hypothetical protein
MDSGADNWVKLNGRLAQGSGKGDMVVDVPDAVFAGQGSNPYVYLYSKFGVNISGNGGYEEWAVAKGCGSVPAPSPAPSPSPSPAPPPVTGSISGFVMDYTSGSAVPVANVLLTLTGATATGQIITLATTTLADGSYSFTGLAAGTYTVTETPPSNFSGITSYAVGTVGGTVDGIGINTTISSIALATGDNGINYNFNEMIPNF